MAGNTHTVPGSNPGRPVDTGIVLLVCDAVAGSEVFYIEKGGVLFENIRESLEREDPHLS